MKLFKLQAIGHCGYDCNAGFVICAPDETAARRIAQKKIADEKEVAQDYWLNPKFSSCVDLCRAVEGVVLTDFNAG